MNSPRRVVDARTTAFLAKLEWDLGTLLGGLKYLTVGGGFVCVCV